MPYLELESVRIDGKDYNVARNPQTRRPVPIVIRSLAPFPPSQLPQAQHGAQDFGLHQRVSLTGPLSIGQRQGNDPRRCYDQENVIAWYPGQITRGPQKQSPTWNGPTTFKAYGFVEAFGKLFMFGDGVAAGAEPVWYLDGTTWTDATLNADVGADVNKVVGMAMIGDTLYAVGDQLKSNGSFDRITYESSDGTTWAETHTDASNETLAAGLFDRLFGLIARYDNTLLSIGWSSTTGDQYPVGHDKTTTGVWSNGGYIFSITPSEEVGKEPRGLVRFPGPDGDPQDIIWASAGRLWHGDRSQAVDGVDPSSILTFADRDGDYTGRLLSDGRHVYFLDGEVLIRLRWESNGVPFYERFSLESLPIEADGNLTAFAFDKTKRWIYVAKGGLAASRNASIFAFDAGDGRFYCPYRNATAQRALTAVAFSTLNDSVPRLHMTEEQAAGGDQDPFFFANISQNPLVNSSFAYAASGSIVDSERDMGFPGYNKGFLTSGADGDDFDTAEKLTVKHAHDGGSFDAGQDLTASGRVYTDGSGAAIGTEAKRQQVQWDFAGTAGATEGPSVKALYYTYHLPAQKNDGNPPREFIMTLELAEDDYRSLTGLSQVTSDIDGLAASATLKTLRLGQTDTKVLFRPYERRADPKLPGVTQNTQPELPGIVTLVAYEAAE